MIKCLGCGIFLQYDNPKKIGYTPKKEAKYCERCFKIKHYNSASIVSQSKDKKEILNIIEDSQKHVIFVVDFLNINFATISLFKKIKNQKTLVITKLDLMAKNIKLNRIKSRLIDFYKMDSEILFVSAFKKLNLKKLLQYLLNNKYNVNYIIGNVNSGKSTLINALYEINNNQKSSITTSSIPNTTLDFIEIKITDNLTLIDSPGFIMENNLFTDYQLTKKINYKKIIKPLTYQVKPNSGILIENKIKIFLTSSLKNSWTFYMSNSLDFKKIFNFNESEHFTLKVNANSDLIINGLGFVNIKDKCEIKIANVDRDLIEIRESIF